MCTVSESNMPNLCSDINLNNNCSQKKLKSKINKGDGFVFSKVSVEKTFKLQLLSNRPLSTGLDPTIYHYSRQTWMTRLSLWQTASTVGFYSGMRPPLDCDDGFRVQALSEGPAISSPGLNRLLGQPRVACTTTSVSVGSVRTRKAEVGNPPWQEQPRHTLDNNHVFIKFHQLTIDHCNSIFHDYNTGTDNFLFLCY